MNVELFFLQPAPGHVVEIYSLHLYHYFLIGYCRALIKTDKHIHFVGGFKRLWDLDMRHTWAVPYEWPSLQIEKASVELVPEQRWMRHSQPPERKS